MLVGSVLVYWFHLSYSGACINHVRTGETIVHSVWADSRELKPTTLQLKNHKSCYKEDISPRTSCLSSPLWRLSILIVLRKTMKMILFYIVMLFDYVLIAIAKTERVVVKNQRVVGTKHARGEKEMHLQDAESAEQAFGSQSFLVPQYPDVHVLHVHIHEGKSVRWDYNVLKVASSDDM